MTHLCNRSLIWLMIKNNKAQKQLRVIKTQNSPNPFLQPIYYFHINILYKNTYYLIMLESTKGIHGKPIRGVYKLEQHTSQDH